MVYYINDERRELRDIFLPIFLSIDIRFIIIDESLDLGVFYLQDFGSEHGIIIDAINCNDNIENRSYEVKYKGQIVPRSQLNVSFYKLDPQNQIIDALLDWGYFGRADLYPKFLASNPKN